MIEIEAWRQSERLNTEHNDLPHVLLVIDQFPKALGGGERIALKVASLLPAHGFRVSILTFFIHPENNVLKMAPCPVYLLPLQRVHGLNALRAAVQLRRFLKTNEVRIVQTFFESSDLWAGFVTKMTSKAKLIWARRDMGILRERKHRIAYRLLASAPDAVFAVSEQVRRYCIEVDHIRSNRVQTIYNGFDVDEWDTLRAPTVPSAEVVVATVGNIRRVKGHDILIRAAAAVVTRFPEIMFSIAGEVLEPDYFQELQALIQHLGIKDHVRFMGDVKDLRNYLAGCAVFVLPSRSEGFSNAIIEAMAASRPVIATMVGGNAEAVKDGVSGLLVPPEDPSSLAAAIIQLLSEPQLAKAMGAAGKSLLADRFTTLAMMNQIVGTFKRLLSDD